jgi:hypothetical protein
MSLGGGVGYSSLLEGLSDGKSIWDRLGFGNACFRL